MNETAASPAAEKPSETRANTGVPVRKTQRAKTLKENLKRRKAAARSRDREDA